MNSTPDTRRWPPTIDFARAPWWVRLRDISLTIIAWAVLAYLMRGGIAMVVDYFVDPIFVLTNTQAPDWPNVWARAQNFLLVSGFVMLLLTLFGFINRHRLRFAAYQTPPAPLELEPHAAAFGLAPGAIERWREMRVSTVDFDAKERIVLPGTAPDCVE